MAFKTQSKPLQESEELEQGPEGCKEVVLFHDLNTPDCLQEDSSCGSGNSNGSGVSNGVIASEDILPVMSWDADWAWTRRIHRLYVNSSKLQFLLAWSSTLGGAHSALGDSILFHAEEAGMISRCQLVLARMMGDDLLAARSKIYAAYSLMQRSHVRQAAKIVRAQYQYLTRDSLVRDKQLQDMCLSIWKRLQHLQRMKKHMIASSASTEHRSANLSAQHSLPASCSRPPPSSAMPSHLQFTSTNLNETPTASCATPTASCDTPTASCDSPTASCDTPTASCDTPTASCDIPTSSNSQNPTPTSPGATPISQSTPSVTPQSTPPTSPVHLTAAS